MADDFKYHIDHHSSLVPPLALLEARGAFARSAIDEQALQGAEDRAVTDALLMQRRVGLNALSDGEFRRRDWLAPMYDAIEGLEPAATASPMGMLVGPRHATADRGLSGRPRARGRLFKQEAASLLSATERSTMLAVPSAGFVAELCAPAQDAPALGRDLAGILHAEIAALAADGVRHVLVRNPAYGFLLRQQGRGRACELGLDPDEVLHRMLAADAQIVDGLETPPECRVSLDVTTGGLVGGAYHREAARGFSRTQPYLRVCVEYPGPEHERFPIAELITGTVVSLGVVDVGDPGTADVDELVDRIDQAAQMLDIDDIAISTNGGFHVSNIQTPDEGRAKLQTVEMIARYFWGNEL